MPVSNPPPDLTIGRYAFHAEIASGGMATVHFARLEGPGGFSRIVAAKRLLPHMVKDGTFTAMLMDEARLAARIRHPNVVSTLDVVSTGDELVVVMEYVHGESLSKLARTASDLGEPISAQLATTLIIDALHGLHAAHEVKDESGNLLGVVHRDVSPQNLIVGVDGITRIADFGIAKAAGRSYETRDGTIKGKLSYMAPEQIERGELTRATDVFAISVVLWELLTGRQLFEGATDVEVMHRVLECNVPLPSSLVLGLPKGYDEIVARGLSRDPSQRFSTARAMALALEAVSTHKRHSEIGAWVEHIASDALTRRSLAISRIERSLPEDVSPTAATKPATPPLGSAADTLGSADTLGTAADALGTAAKVSWAGPNAGRNPSWFWVAALATALGVIVGLAVFARQRRNVPVASTAAPSAPSFQAPTGTPAEPAPPTVSAPAVSAPELSARPTVSAVPLTSSAGVVDPSKPLVKPRRAEAAAGSRPKSTANCDPPYSIDASGRRIFKLQCM